MDECSRSSVKKNKHKQSKWHWRKKTKNQNKLNGITFVQKKEEEETKTKGEFQQMQDVAILQKTIFKKIKNKKYKLIINNI